MKLPLGKISKPYPGLPHPGCLDFRSDGFHGPRSSHYILAQALAHQIGDLLLGPPSASALALLVLTSA